MLSLNHQEFFIEVRQKISSYFSTDVDCLEDITDIDFKIRQLTEYQPAKIDIEKTHKTFPPECAFLNFFCFIMK